VRDVSDVVGQLYHVAEAGPGSREAPPEVLEHLPRLSLRVALADKGTMLVQRDLARYRDQAA
jgi:hypothetical protein